VPAASDGQLGTLLEPGLRHQLDVDVAVAESAPCDRADCRHREVDDRDAAFRGLTGERHGDAARQRAAEQILGAPHGRVGVGVEFGRRSNTGRRLSGDAGEDLPP
jgi:hypothetical protein